MLEQLTNWDDRLSCQDRFHRGDLCRSGEQTGQSETNCTLQVQGSVLQNRVTVGHFTREKGGQAGERATQRWKAENFVSYQLVTEKKTNEKALLDSVLLNQKSWTKNPALPHPRPTSCSCCLSAVLLEETGGGTGSWLTSLNHCYFNWTLIPPQHVWQHSMHPPPPMPSSFSLLAKQGDFFYWHGDAADWIQLFVLISLLYFREVEGLALQSQLHYKAEKKFTVQVTSKKECTPFIAQCCTWTRSWEIIWRFGILVTQS